MTSTNLLHISKIFINRDNRLLAAGEFIGTLQVDKKHVITSSNETNTDGFILKLSPYLNKTEWVYHIQGVSDTVIITNGITGDIESNTYVVGCFVGSLSQQNGSYSKYRQLFIAKLNSGGGLSWLTVSDEATGDVCGVSVTVSPINGLFVSGSFTKSFRYDKHTITTSNQRSSVYLLSINPKTGQLQSYSTLDKFYPDLILGVNSASMVVSNQNTNNYILANTVEASNINGAILISMDSKCQPDWQIQALTGSNSTVRFWDNALMKSDNTITVVASHMGNDIVEFNYKKFGEEPVVYNLTSLVPSKFATLTIFTYDTRKSITSKAFKITSLHTNYAKLIKLSVTANQNNNLYISGEAVGPVILGPSCEYTKRGHLVAFVMVFDDDLELHYCKWVDLKGNITLGSDASHSSETFYAYQYLYLMYNDIRTSALLDFRVEPGINPEFVTMTLIYLLAILLPAIILCALWQIRNFLLSLKNRVRTRSDSMLGEKTALLQFSSTNTVDSDYQIRPRVSACFSGGGIRSASVTLGVLKELDNQGILKDMEYIAGVSGGNYTTSAFISHLNAHFSKDNKYKEALAALETQMEENCNFLLSSVWRALRTFSALFMALAYSILNFVCLSLLLCEVLVGASAILDKIPVSKIVPGLGAQIKLLKFDIINGVFTTSAFYTNPTNALIKITIWAAVLTVLVTLAHVYDSVCHALVKLFRCNRFAPFILDSFMSKITFVIIFGMSIVVSVPVVLEILKSFMFIHGRMLLLLFNKFGGEIGLFFLQIPIAIGYMGISLVIIVCCYKIIKNPTICLSVFGFYGATIPCVLIMSSVFFYRNVFVMLGGADSSTTFASWIPIIATGILILLQIFYPFCHGALHITYRSRIVESFYHNSTDLKFSELHPDLKPTLLSVVTVNNMKSSKLKDRAHPMTFSSEGVECDDIGYVQTGAKGTDHFVGLIASLSGAAISIHLGNMDGLSSFNFRFFLVLFSATLGSWYPMGDKNKTFYTSTFLFFLTYSSSIMYIMLQQRKLFLWNVTIFENIGYCVVIALVLASPFFIWIALYACKTPSYIMGLPFIRTMLHLSKIKQRKYDPLFYLSDGAHVDLLGLYPLLVKRQTVIMVFDASDDKDNTRMGLLQALSRAESTRLISNIGWDSISDENNNEKSWCIVKFTYTDSNIEGKIIYKQTRIDNKSDYYLQLYQRQNPLYPYHPLINQFYSQDEFLIYKKLGEDCVKAIESELKFIKDQLNDTIQN
jgi:hypothetical protein